MYEGLQVAQGFFYGLVDGFAVQVAGDDGAVGREEDNLGYALEAIDSRGNVLCVDDLRPGHLLLFESFEGGVTFVPYGYAYHFEVVAGIFLIEFLDARYTACLLYTSPSPRDLG